jgi:hypothetical protein
LNELSTSAIPQKKIELPKTEEIKPAEEPKKVLFTPISMATASSSFGKGTFVPASKDQADVKSSKIFNPISFKD